MKILFAVDGSDYTIKAANFLAKHFEWFQGTPELHLLHVKVPIPIGLAVVRAERILGADAVDTYYREEAEAALAPAETILRRHRIPFLSTFKVGEVAKEINAYAAQHRMDMIVMGSHGHGSALSNLLMGSVTTKVLATTDIPVLIVS